MLYEADLFNIAIDLEVALMWFQKAAEGGNDDAQSRLGDAYEGGLLGPKIDIEMALMWFKKAAEGGDHDAQRRLGWAYMDGTLGLKGRSRGGDHVAPEGSGR